MNLDQPPRPADKPGKRAALVMAVVVHLVLLGFLVYGVRWQTQTPEAVEVELVRSLPSPHAAPAAEAEPPRPEPRPESRPEVRPEPKPQPRPEPRVEPKAVAKPDIALKEKEKEKPRKEAEREPEPKKDSLFDKLNRELDQVTHRNKSSNLASALDKELAQTKASQSSAASAKAMGDYVGKIKGKIKGNWVLPPDVKGNPEAIFDVVQLPSGEVLSAKLRKSSGNPALDAAIERAILKSSPLPQPPRPDLFARELELRFKPLEE